MGIEVGEIRADAPMERAGLIALLDQRDARGAGGEGEQAGSEKDEGPKQSGRAGDGSSQRSSRRGVGGEGRGRGFQGRLGISSERAQAGQNESGRHSCEL